MREAHCVLAVQDLKASTAFYRDILGFAIDLEIEGWSFISRGNFRLMLGECRDALPAASIGDHSYFAYVLVDAVDDLYAEYHAKGVRLVFDIANRPWGRREFGIATPDGHRIMFAQKLPANEST